MSKLAAEPMKHLTAALRATGLLLLTGYFLYRLDTSGFSALVSWRAAGWIAAALLVYCVGQFLNGLAWRHLLNRVGAEVTLREMILHDLSSVFWSTVLPGGVVGELVKGVRLARNADPGSVAVSILCARLIGGTVCCLLALVCLPSSGFDGLYRAVGATALIGTCVVGIGGLFALKLGPAAMPRAVASRLPVGRFPEWRELASAFGLAILTHSAFALVYSACFGAAGQWIPFSEGAVVSALTSVAQIVPITVGGFGIRELTITGLGAALVPPATADAATVTLAGTFTVFVLLGGMVEVYRMVQASR